MDDARTDTGVDTETEPTAIDIAAPAEALGGKPANGSTYTKSKVNKVLAIDDSPEIRLIIGETLNLFGFTTLIAEDGCTGLEMARETLPDLILCDINMPNLDGYGTLKAMREHEATAAIPFIFLSGATDRVTVRKGMELGADDYLTKPFTPKELLAAVNTRLEKQAELQRLSDRRLNELRGNLTLALPHELRTPLHGIMGLASLMMDDYAQMPPEEVLESARFIHESSLRLHRLIENFLLYSQISLLASESKTIQVPDDIKPVAAHEVIPELARKTAAQHKRAGDLLLKIENANLFLPPENLSKILEETIDNALKFSELGKPVLVATEHQGGRFYLTIADKGRGMTTEQISRIGPHIQFERKTFEQQGAGLGLFIAKRITELLGGQFDVSSKVSSGTTVKISFPSPLR